MKDATLKQAGKIISIFEDTSRERVQAILPYLAILRDANVAEMNLDDFRKACGLKSFISSFRYDKRNDGWELSEDVEDVEDSGEISLTNLEPVSFLKLGEDYIDGEEMARRAIALRANYGQRTAEYLLVHQDQIPEGLRPYILVFPGTKWRDRDGRRLVVFLHWLGREWSLNFRWLGRDWWDMDDRLVCPRE